MMWQCGGHRQLDSKLLENGGYSCPSNIVLLCWISFLGCCNKGPLAGWLKTTELYYLTVVEARSSESWYWQGHAASETRRGDSLLVFSWLLVFDQRFWVSLAHRNST